MKKIFFTLIITFLLSALFPLSTTKGQDFQNIEYHKGEILRILDQEDIIIEEVNDVHIYITFEIELESGEIISSETSGFKSLMQNTYQEGDKIILSSNQLPDGGNIYSIIAYDRQNPLIILFTCFLLIALAISLKKTIGALLGLIFSFSVIFLFLIPQILQGHSPILLSIFSAIIIIPVTFYLSHGYNKKTNIAILSTILALCITGFLATIFMSISNITGGGLEEATFIRTVIGEKIQIQGLLLAGVIIATLGVLNDVTISQSAIVEQISEIGKDLSKKEICMRAMLIGKDHMASMINTLVLVYAGASMPILIIFINSDLPINYVLSLETISMEIIRTLVGTIGLISAIPITSLIATNIFKEK